MNPGPAAELEGELMDVVGHSAQQGLEVVGGDENPLECHGLVIGGWGRKEEQDNTARRRPRAIICPRAA
jgi:hypothetical protein